MTTNFTIKDNHTVICGSNNFDLHNDYDFDYLDKIENDKVIKIHFIKTNGNWVNANNPERLFFVHLDYEFIKINEGDSEANREDKKTLSELTFFPSSLREINDSLILQEIPKVDDDIIYFFEDGKTIRIKCKKIELVER